VGDDPQRRAAVGVLASAGVVLGKTYPLPVVDHAAARVRALAALRGAKNLKKKIQSD
jgi:deoxyribodipyrimidine photo-lyase